MDACMGETIAASGELKMDVKNFLKKVNDKVKIFQFCCVKDVKDNIHLLHNMGIEVRYDESYFGKPSGKYKTWFFTIDGYEFNYQEAEDYEDGVSGYYRVPKARYSIKDEIGYEIFDTGFYENY